MLSVGCAPLSCLFITIAANTATGPAYVQSPQRRRFPWCQKLKLTKVPNSVAIAVVSCLDLNALDNLSRSCRQVRVALLQYRSSLVGHTLHCVNEKVALDPEDTMRYRARASNLFYMEEVGRGSYNGKSGQCARDMVSECRRCARVVCRVRRLSPVNLGFDRARL
jgi:hypothetical protein